MFILYFAGFATAVYILAPQPDTAQIQINGQEVVKAKIANFDSQEFIQTFNSGLHKGIFFGKEAAIYLSKFIKEKAKDSELMELPQQSRMLETINIF